MFMMVENGASSEVISVVEPHGHPSSSATREQVSVVKTATDCSSDPLTSSQPTSNAVQCVFQVLL